MRGLSAVFVLPLVLVLAISACGGGSGSGSSSKSQGGASPEGTSPVSAAPLSAPAPSFAPLEARPPPNILLIVADDLGYNDLAINNGNPAIETPNLDQLARRGVRFTRHYAQPVCSASRAALFTGQYPERNGFLPGGRGIPAERVTLAEHFQQAGYTTWHIGKWHLGHTLRDAWPDRQGFDHWLGFLDQWRLAGQRQGGQLVPARPRYENPWLEGSEEAGRHFQGHLNDILTDQALKALKQLGASPAPWLINLWYYAPHSPVSPSAAFAAQSPDTPAGRYRALVKQLDSNIGRLLHELDSSAAAGNTLVVFLSDNGGTSEYVDSNSPLPGSKNSLLEGGIRTPLLIRLPDPALNGQVIDAAVNIMDIYPTLAALAGSDADAELDGRSLLPLLGGEPDTSQMRFWDYIFESSILSADGRWRLRQGKLPAEGEAEPALYDYQADPAAQIVLSPPAPEADIADLRDSYSEWHREIHRVPTRYSAQDWGGEMSGFDVLRTPGYGGHTLAVAFDSPYSGSLAAQGDIWEIGIQGLAVSARFGELSLSGALADSEGCHSIISSGYFHRDVSHLAGGDRTTLELYIDGQLADTVDAAGALAVDDTGAPTRIGDRLLYAGNGAIRHAEVLNVMVGPWHDTTAVELHRELCGKP